MKELCLEEKLLSYSKYYYWAMDAPDPLATQIMNCGMIDPKLALKPDNLNDLLNPGYLPVEQGHCIMPNGSGFIANYTKMPGVTPEMIDWWFVWHFFTPPSVPAGNGNLRYKIWNPSDHWDTGLADEESRKRALDPGIPMREKRQGTQAYIEEFIGNEKMSLLVFALPLEDFGFDMKRIANPESGTITAAWGGGEISSINVHQYRPINGGVELRSRYWLGYKIADKKPVRITGGPQPTEELARSLLLHNMKEYPHLAKFLPKLYAEESRKPVNVY